MRKNFTFSWLITTSRRARSCDNEKKIVRVTDVEYLQPEEAPFPVEETKKLIRRLTPEEYESYVEEGED